MDLAHEIQLILEGPIKTNPTFRAIQEGNAKGADPQDDHATISYLVDFTEALMALVMAQGRALMVLADAIDNLSGTESG